MSGHKVNTVSMVTANMRLKAGKAREPDSEPSPMRENRDANAERPLIVLYDPQYKPTWDRNPNHFTVDHFFNEASITDGNARVLRGRFDKFCSQSKVDAPHMTADDFARFNNHYKVCAPEDEAHYFRVMDHSGSGKMSFQDFLLGCSAANPTTPHILNSYTGYMRARYLFDFYNTSCTGTLDFEELARLLRDAKQHLKEPDEKLHSYIIEVAQELGEVQFDDIVTLRISCSGRQYSTRVCRRWAGRTILREVSKLMQVPSEGLELTLNGRPFTANMVLDNAIPQGVREVRMSVALALWEAWPHRIESNLSDSIQGLERFVYVTFESFYEALTCERLRGTSRLFRFRKQILQLSEAPRAKAKVARRVGGA